MAKRVLNVAIAPRTILLAIALVVALLAVREFKTLIGLFLIAVVIASALQPLVAALERRRIPRILSILLVFAGLAAFVGLIGLLVVPVVLEQAQTFARDLPTYNAMFQSWLDRVMLLQARYQFLPETSHLTSQVSTWLTQRLTGWVQTGIAYTLTALTLVGNVFAIGLMSLYLLLGGEDLMQGLVQLVPARHRELLAAQFEPIGARLGAYVRGLLTSMSSLAVLLSIGLSVIGLPYAWLLAILSGLLEIIPYLGSIVGILLSSLIALTVSWKLVLLVILVYTVCNIIQGNILGPIIFSRAVSVPPLLVVLSLLIGSQLLGLLGAILAVPVTATLMLLLQNLWVPLMDRMDGPPPVAPPPELPPGPKENGRP